MGDLNSAFREVVDDILCMKIRNQSELEARKKDVAGRFGLSSLPSNADILNVASEDERPGLKLLVRKPTRTLSGVAVIAAMTSPARCPHGVCVPCPGGINYTQPSPQSYTGSEPAAMRAGQHGFDPYSQVSARLSQLDEIGHVVEKAELIVMGGTITSRPLGYQSWFVKRCLQAMNDFPGPEKTGYKSFKKVALDNENALVKNVGITFETRPDWCKEHQVRLMLAMGGTKVELGVQSIRDEILTGIRRGHTVDDVIKANETLREAGIKVGFHMMPGLPGSTPLEDFEEFVELFRSPDFRPDYLKIYPTLVIAGTRLHEMFKSSEYQPLYDEDAADLVSKVKAIIPPYTRLSRVQRDIPARLIEAGVKKSNLRQMAGDLLHRRGGKCRCIRCREAGLRGVKDGVALPRTLKYEACGGDEFFLSFETESDVLVGFTRLRLSVEARIRELHVYGPLVPVGKKGGWQHQGYGAKLLERAEDIARDAGYSTLSVTSGIGVRGYYRELGYDLRGTYMVKDL